MNKKYLYGGAFVLALLLFIFVIPNYFTGNVTAGGISISGDIEKLEIIHFHGTNQCISCVTLGDFAEETIKEYFDDELKSGKITFAHLNGELPENRDKVIKYGSTGSSLWIGTYYKDGTFVKEENINLWYRLNNKNDYMDYLKNLIEEKISN